MTSPTFTSLLCTLPTMFPLHDGPFSNSYPLLPGAFRRPLMIWPPVTSVPPPEMTTYVSV